MRQFQRILAQLKELTETHRAGDSLTPPSHLPFISVNGQKIYYATMGPEEPTDHPAVILLHGFGGFFMDWPRVMAPISKHARVYALDLQGWGFSDLNPSAAELEDEVAIVREFIRALELEKTIVAGLSYGAGVAWATAAMNVPRVKRVVLINPMPPHPLKFLVSPIYQGIFAICRTRAGALFGHKLLRKVHYKLICRESLLDNRTIDNLYVDLAYLALKQPKTPFILNALAKGASQTNWAEWEHRLAGTRVPVSILQGNQDRVFSFEGAAHLYELIPNSELIEVEDCGHAMVFDQPRVVSDFIIAALDRKDDAADALENRARKIQAGAE